MIAICPKNTKKYEVCWDTSLPNTFASYFLSMVVQPPAFHEDQAMYSSATK